MFVRQGERLPSGCKETFIFYIVFQVSGLRSMFYWSKGIWTKGLLQFQTLTDECSPNHSTRKNISREPLI